MSDNDFIRRGDAARAVALCSAESDSPNAHFVCRQAVNAIRAIPAAEDEAATLRARLARMEGALFLADEACKYGDLYPELLNDPDGHKKARATLSEGAADE